MCRQKQKVSLVSLKKQFQRELKTNPKKAAILGLLALVAIYFWAPLAMKMVGGSSKSASKPIAQQESTTASAQAKSPTVDKQANAPAQQPVPQGPSWDKLLKWIEKDPLTTSYLQLKTEHDPFKRVKKIIESPELEAPLAENIEEAPVAEPVRDLSPVALGMQLTSTIVGSGRSVAMIDDRAYALGHRVVAYDGNEKLYFELVEIRPDRVVMSRENQEYVLKLRQTDALSVSVEDIPEL